MIESTKQVIGIDLGGTKVVVGAVSGRGDLDHVIKEKVILEQGPSGLIAQLARMVLEVRGICPGVTAVGLASAGPLDPLTGRWLDPTNLRAEGSPHWGAIPIGPLLSAQVGLPVHLENDAAAAALAEAWLGAGKDCENFVLMTLGTGLGVGVIANGQLLRSGRGLHPEVGHVYLKAGDPSAPCGCGNFGCAEAFLSGTNFTRRWAQRWHEPSLTGEDLVEGARRGEKKYLEAFREYSALFADMITTLAVLFCPEKILISGGFCEAVDLFLPTSHQLIELQLKSRRQGVDLLPEIEVAQLGSHTGLLGGAYVALQAN